MLATLLIVFREVLEAALIIGIVMAASRGLAGRNLWVGIGVGGGLAGALLLALGAGGLAQLAAGMGAEIFNAAILLLAVAMLGWHSIAMQRHGRDHSQRAGAMGEQVAGGSKPLYALAIVVGVAVLREGAETVLFLYGIAASEGTDAAPAMLVGGAIGIGLGVALGALIYFGLSAIPLRRLFAVTNILILLMAAGLAAQAAGYLIQADLVPSLGAMVWDTSGVLAEDSAPGRVLHTLVGYIDRPAGIQVIVYLLTLTVIAGASRLAQGGARLAGAVAIAVLLGGAWVLTGTPARADFQVRAPIVDESEIELEHNGALIFDRHDKTRIAERSYTASIGYGVNSWLFLEFEGEWEGAAGTRTKFVASTLEATFQLTPQGKYFADFGWFFEFSKAALRGEPDVVEFGPLMQIELRPFVLTLNILAEKQVFSHNASSAITVGTAFQAMLPLHPLFQPVIEYYGEIEDIRHAGKWRDQAHRIGPGLTGGASLAPGVKAKYEAAFLIPLSRGADGNALRWKTELEFAF